MTPTRKARPLLEVLEGRAMPTTFAVTTTLDVVDPADGKLSLREAVTRANNHAGADVIALPAGVFRIALAGAGEDANATGDFDVTGTTLFRGAGAGATVVDGQQLDRVFDVLGTAPSSIRVVFQGLTVRNGRPDGNGLADTGGGIRAGNADLVVRDSAVTGNRAVGGPGGGISNAALPGTGNVTLIRSAVSRNVSAGEGGGVNVLGDGSVLNVVGSTIRRNLGGNGGGISAVTVTLTDSAVTGNVSNNSGGGIQATTATLTNSIVSGNIADNIGGGIFATTATLTGSTISGNRTADLGGGIAADSATLTNCTVSGNIAPNSEGGGIWAGVLRLVGSTVAGNFAPLGGGVFADSATLTNSTVSGNHATNGGGIRAITATLVRSTVSGNAADLDGGGILATTATVTNSTVSGNSAAREGGGIRASGVTLLNNTVTDNSARLGGGVFLAAGGASVVRNTIIADNLVNAGGIGPDVFGAFTSDGHNLIGDGTGATGFANGVNGDIVGTSENPIDPLLGPLANNGGRTKTHNLLAGSPAIDHGDNAAAPATDQRGLPRKKDGNGDGSKIVDIGAFER